MDFGLNCRLFTRPTTLPKVEIFFRMDYLGGVGFLDVESCRTRTALIGGVNLIFLFVHPSDGDILLAGRDVHFLDRSKSEHGDNGYQNGSGVEHSGG